MRQATAQELTRILRDHSRELESKQAVSPAQLSLPTDGDGAKKPAVGSSGSDALATSLLMS